MEYNQTEFTVLEALNAAFGPVGGIVTHDSIIRSPTGLFRYIDVLVEHENHFYVIEVKAREFKENSFLEMYSGVVSSALMFQEARKAPPSDVHVLIVYGNYYRQDVVGAITRDAPRLKPRYRDSIIVGEDLADPLALYELVKHAPSLDEISYPTPPPAPKRHSIFISYRRSDNAWAAGRLADHLRSRFHPDEVFFDTRSIDLGDDFVDVITKRIEGSSVVIVIIGPDWLTVSFSNGRRRLDADDDFVRLEIRLALDKKLIVIPVLIDGTHMPNEYDLPADISELARKTAGEWGRSRAHELDEMGRIGRITLAIELAAIPGKDKQLNGTT